MSASNPVFVRAIGDLGLLSAEEMQDVLGPAQDASRLLRYLLLQQSLPKQDALRMWAEGFGVAYLDLESTLFQPEVVARLPRAAAEKSKMILVYQMGEAITAAMADPGDRQAIAAAAGIVGTPISPVCALPDQINQAIELHYHSFDELSALKREAALATAMRVADRPLTKDELERLAGQEIIVKLVQTLLLLAIKEGASDIHVEPFEPHVLVRFRIDGELVERTRLSLDVYPKFLSRVKIIAGMDITEKRRPQDGRITLDVGGRNMDFRVSTVPALNGEKVALRILGQLRAREIPDLDELDLSRGIFEQVQRLVLSPNGVFFVTGPTGSGKTTTLFSALKYINRPGINIMTVEDPVEYRLPGITQVPVNRAAGVGFPEALRAFLRQDPDVMLIGEIRDLETARIATQAALTGHLVLATLHTNDAVQATTRLVEIGVEPFLVGPSIIGVMAQRLVRRICTSCKQAYEPGKEVMDRLFEWDGTAAVSFHRGAGCSACGQTGYRGRLGIHEMLIVNDDIRRLIVEKAPAQAVYAAAFEAGYQGLRYDGLKKVLRGLTTLEEVERVAP